jgi:ribosome-binding protein aMBF1 (putative translation factor)
MSMHVHVVQRTKKKGGWTKEDLTNKLKMCATIKPIYMS